MRGYDAFNRSLGAYRQKKARIYTRAEEKYNGKKISESNRQRIFSRRQRSFLNAGCFSLPSGRQNFPEDLLAIASVFRSDRPAFQPTTRHSKSPCAPPRTDFTPLPRIRNSLPVCVSLGTFSITRPSNVGTSISPPSAAIAKLIGTSQ